MLFVGLAVKSSTWRTLNNHKLKADNVRMLNERRYCQRAARNKKTKNLESEL